MKRENFTNEMMIKKFDSLTNRENEILEKIVEGKTNKEIAKELFISVRTVDTHRQRLLSKFEVKNIIMIVRAFYLLKINDK